MDVNNIPIDNMKSIAADDAVYDGAPVMMGKKKGRLKLMKEENTEEFLHGR